MRFESSCRPTVVDSVLADADADLGAAALAVVVALAFLVVAMGSKSSLQQSTRLASHPNIILLGLGSAITASLPYR